MIAPIDPDDAPVFAALLALNNDNAEALSPLDATRFAHLCRAAFAAWHAGGDALLIALDQDADYDSENFIHLRSRFARFVYIDRIVVAARARGRGLAGRLYDALDAAARRAGHRRLLCEVNIDPPNPDSDRFHAARGFTPIGEAVLGNGKHVGYLAKEIGSSFVFRKRSKKTLIRLRSEEIPRP